MPAPAGPTEPAGTGDDPADHRDPPIALTQWQIPDLAARPRAAAPAALSAYLAGRLVGAYSRPGDLIVSVGADPALTGAAGAGGRRCLLAAGPEDLLHLGDTAHAATLVVLPWPAPMVISPAHDLPELLRTCRRLLAPGGCAIVVSAPDPGREADHHSTVITAARQAGLILSQHILAMTRRRLPRRNAAAPTPAGLGVIRLELGVYTFTSDHHD